MKNERVSAAWDCLAGLGVNVEELKRKNLSDEEILEFYNKVKGLTDAYTGSIRV